MIQAVSDYALPPDGAPRGRAPARERPQTPPPRTAEHAQDPAVLAVWVEAHFRVVWRTLRRLGLSAPDADDAAQQVFLIARDKFSAVHQGKERSFLVGVAYRVAANTRRSCAKHSHDEMVDHHTPDRRPTPEDLLEQRRSRALLDEVLNTLPITHRSVFVLHELEGLTGPEIASALDLPLGTTASRLRRARALFLQECQRLRRKLGMTGPPESGETHP